MKKAAMVMAIVMVTGCASTRTVYRPTAEAVGSLPRPEASALTPEATIAVTVNEASAKIGRAHV